MAPVTQQEAAEILNTSQRGIQRAAKVQANGSAKLNEAIDAGQLSLGKAEQIVKTYPDQAEQDRQVNLIAKSKMVSRVKNLTGEYEWYTPRKYLDAAVEVMGAIDLDPASSDLAQEHVKAGKYFTIEDNGLVQAWHGRVFLNPPYAMPHVKDFAAKISSSWTEGDITAGILLTNNATDTSWWHEARKACTAVCFTLGRISFLEAHDGDLIEKPSPTHGQTFFYFGPDPEAFSRVFSQFGGIMVNYRLLSE